MAMPESIDRRGVLRTGLAAAAAASPLAWTAPARAAYPERTVKLIVPFAAGGGADVAGRLLAKILGDAFPEAVVVENRGGAGGITGMDAVAKAAPDGYTLLVAHSGFTMMPGLYPRLPFDPVKDFDPVINAITGAYALAAASRRGFKSVADVVAEARAKPGSLTYGSAGAGSTVHLAGELFKAGAGIDIRHVPYKGGGPALADLVGGHIDLLFGPAVNVVPLDRSGEVKALGIASLKRSALAPELPTIAEAGGGLSTFAVDGWYGLVAPAGTQKEAVGRLNSTINKALAAPELIELLRKQGLEPVGGPPEAAGELIRTEVERWTRVIRQAGIKPE